MIYVRYLIVARQLSDAINCGKYPVGTLLPTELELSEMYQVSRHTVRAAIARLQEQGLVSRKKRVGTRVESATAQKGYSQALASISDLAHLAKTQMREVREVGHFVAEISQAELLGLEPGRKYFRVSSVRTDSEHPGKPICWTDVYAPEEYAPVIPLAKERKGELIAAIIETEFGLIISTVEQRIEAVLMTEPLATELNSPAGEPALQITRIYRDQDTRMMAMSVTIHPRERFTLVMQIARDSL
ncbi:MULTISPECIES: GntR family transcriptional regulator [Klebsiella]|uniref:GntR family transcriptional regulator n=1 Tax=Klebsiella TaxID=570 RepID=UPI000D745B4A|nr:GntR family transcriptional regulator [Klebsiella variicola]MCD9672780.1 GntR family transcriptional regulator [Klebsiella variicola subsp. variicola]MCK6050139.1 GntR family transcriptional regulator [Klebsiella variicola]PXL43358.1 GntR family transcriptional regulator [Klebsiella variicola]